MFENLGAYESGDGQGVMFTITAPGCRELPWDETYCAPLGKHRHSGDLGCRVEPRAAREWNQSASERYGRLRVAARALTQRKLGSRCHKRHYRALNLARTWEHQSRGVLHAHVVCGRGTWGEKLVADTYGRALRDLAPHYGFGRVDTPLAPARAAREAAAYISSYLSTGKGAKRRLGETVLSDEMPRSIIHVSTELTLKTGCTMRALRFRRLVWCRWEVLLPFPEQRQIQQLVDAFPGCVLERGPPDASA